LPLSFFTGLLEKMKNNINIISIADENEVLHESVKKLNLLLEKNKDIPILLLLSGGSSLQLIEGIEAKYLTRSLTVTALDERYSSDEKVNNFAQIAHSDFYEMLMRHGANVIDTRVHHDESQNDLAKRYEEGLRTWISKNPKGKIIATMGIGEDAHIAGIVPHNNEVHLFNKLFDSSNWIASYDAGDKNPYPERVTTTLTFLRKIDHAVVYVVGDNKKEALDNTLREENNLHTFPARIVHQMKDVHIYTDQT